MFLGSLRNFFCIFFTVYFSGCVSENARAPLFLPKYHCETLKTANTYHTSYGFDYNGDGSQDLFLCAKKEILCFLHKNLRLQTLPSFRFVFEKKIYAFDLIRAPGHIKGWLVVLSGKDIFFFDGEKSSPQKIYTLKSDQNYLFYPVTGQIFRDINRDGFPDIVIPFRRKGKWYAGIYIYEKRSFRFLRNLSLGGDRYFFPPSFHVFSYNFDIEILLKDLQKLNFLYFDHHFQKKTARSYSTRKLIPQEKNILNLIAAKQLNRENYVDLIFGSPQGQKVWVWIDHKTLYALNTPCKLNFGVVFQDYNNDGWSDIFCIALRETSFWEILWGYLSTGQIPVFIDIYMFLNQEGTFASTPSKIWWKKLWVSRGNRQSFRKYFLEDLDDDGLLDGIAFDKKGTLSFYYNILRQPHAQYSKSVERLLEEIKKRLLMVNWPKFSPDSTITIPSPDSYREIKIKALKISGGNSHIVLHYKSDTGDLIVVVYPQNQIF